MTAPGPPAPPPSPKPSEMASIAKTALATLAAVGAGGGGFFGTTDYVIAHGDYIAAEREACAGAITRLQADKALLVERNDAQVEQHRAAYEAMLCEWAMVLRCNGAAISLNVGGGVCREMLEAEACPAANQGASRMVRVDWEPPAWGLADGE